MAILDTNRCLTIDRCHERIERPDKKDFELMRTAMNGNQQRQSCVGRADNAFNAWFLCVLFTGDIHGWQPGPIGQVGRIIVTTLGSRVFWTPLVYWIYRKIKK